MAVKKIPLLNYLTSVPIPSLKIKKSTDVDPYQKMTYLPRRHHQRAINQRVWPLLLALLVVGFFSLALFYVWLARSLPSPEGVLTRQVSSSTTIFDRTGKTVLYSVHGGIKRTLINLEELPPYVKWATITIEDKNFYQHRGFDLRGILRSIVVDLIRGGKAQGGSSITQQFIKNAILTPEKSYTRKFKELILAYQLEKKFTKDQILQMYFNEIPYGSVAYGIEAAAQTYFGKNAKNLTVLEAAVLAALPQAPTYYSPYGNHRDELLGRAKYIIDQMVTDGHLTEPEAILAKQEKIKFKPKQENILAPHFVMYIKEILAQKYGENFIEQEGLKVYTTLDWELQQKAETILKEQIVKNTRDWKATNAAAIVLDASTGQILTMIGSADYFDEKIDGQVNVVLRPRQPGSSFKPIVYTAAFKKGYTPDTILFDLVTRFINFDGQDYEPHNYNGQEYGPVTMRQALAGSLNIPAVKTVYLTGLDNVLDLADSLGYTTLKDRSRFGLSLVLGGGEVILLEHAQAFSVLAQEGLLHPASPILKIENKDGQIIDEWQKTEKRVLEAELTRQTTNILSDNAARSFIFGEQNYLTLPDRAVAAKTGTTNNFRDAWTVGFTPSRVVGVWVGNANNKEMRQGADGSKIAAPIWQKIINEAVKNIPPETFATATPLLTNKPILNGQLSAENIIKIDKASGKLATNLTPPNFIIERVYRQVHDILYYLNKDDPQGESPTNAAADPQFVRWEEPVQVWAKNQGYLTGDQPPTQYDDLHIPENRPTLNVVYPTPNLTIDSASLVVQLTTSARRGVYRLEFYLDGQLVTTNQGAINSPALDLSNLSSGFHTLGVKSFDDIDNSTEVNIDFNLLK